VPYNYIFNIVGSATINSTDPFNSNKAQVFTDLEHFAYQSLMDMIGHLINGQISVNYRGVSGSFNFTTTTSIIQTALTTTPELHPIFEIAEVCLDGASACKEESTNANLNITTPKNGMHLPQALEQLFQNMTLSLFSDPTFLTDKANSPSVDVIIRSPENRYVYTTWRLVVPYMISLALSAVGLAFGFQALLANSVSYSGSFSTVLRTTRYAQMDIQMDAKDLGGTDPTPKYIQKARINFGSVISFESSRKQLHAYGIPSTRNDNNYKFYKA
jgi:hypothetical protein